MPERTTFEELMTVGEVAETLRYTEGTVRHWIRTGKLPAIQVPGGREYRIRLPVFPAFAEGLGIPVRSAGPGAEARLEDEPLSAQLRRREEPPR
jgi:excisionase family DNA binding protein